MPYDPETDDPNFREDLLGSLPAVFAMGHWLVRCGYDITVPGVQIRDKVENRYDFSDKGDIIVYGEEKPRTVDVKQRSLDFEGPESYGTKSTTYNTVFVNKKYIHDDEEYDLYVIFDEDRSHCILVTGDTESEWGVVKKRDRGQKLKFYEIDKSLCTFRKVPEFIP